MKETVEITGIKKITHDVLEINTQKPDGLSFTPGQATEVSINKEGWKEEGRPFTFTSLPGDDHLQFVIKTYPSRKGVTAQLLNLGEGDELILEDVFGDIAYKGKGIFIAGGAGITPFIPIFRQLEASGNTGGNKLLFANKTKKDIILESYFRELLGANFINILSEEKTPDHAHGLINKEFIKEHMGSGNPYFYLCGPPPMMKAVDPMFRELGINEDRVVREPLE